MTETATNARIVLTTAGTIDEARALGRTLVDEHLAACATIIPAVESIYRWQGKLETGAETMLLLKTGAEHLSALEARLLALHSYSVPEFLVIPVESGSAAYLEWLASSLQSGS